MSSAIRLGICRILSRGCQLHRKCADLRTVAGLPRKLRVDGYPFWPTLPRLRLSTSHQHWWSLEVSISPCMVGGKGVGGTDFNWQESVDGYGCVTRDYRGFDTVNSKEVVNSGNFAILRSSQCSVPCVFKETNTMEDDLQENFQTSSEYPNIKVTVVWSANFVFQMTPAMSKWSRNQDESTFKL